MIMEIWKDIQGYEGLYQVSNLGRVKSLARIAKGRNDSERQIGGRFTAVVDTAAIIEDWITKREYKQTLFDNTHGKLDIDFTVQYNKPTDLRYSYIPIKEVNTIYKVKVWQPYASASYSTLNYVGVGLGIFYHDVGFGAKYVTDFNKKGVEFELKYKF